jgi:hypothetical protein
MTPPVLMAEPKAALPLLSNDALTVRVLLHDLKPVRYTGHALVLIQRMGYLSDWTRERWDQATLEVAAGCRPVQSLPSDMSEVIDAIVP